MGDPADVAGAHHAHVEAGVGGVGGPDGVDLQLGRHRAIVHHPGPATGPAAAGGGHTACVTTIRDVLDTLERAYPAALAESWDTGIGLTCGDPDDPVTGVLLAVDVDAVTVAETAEVGAQLLVTHHPLLFRAVQSVAADPAKGSLCT